MRGNRSGQGRASASAGSIPACAGEPGVPCRHRRSRRVYPRVCGGTSAGNFNCIGSFGLSPRVRGNRVADGDSDRYLRSIPACAGEPHHRSASSFYQAVYPRVCGGTRYQKKLPMQLKGLSPRVRGNHNAFGLSTETLGSIPACAGEPASLSGTSRANGVYPRVCGGTLPNQSTAVIRTGLSPRVRGNHIVTIDASDRQGSIPACAGEPRHGTAVGSVQQVYPRVCGGTFCPSSRPSSI